MHMAREEGMDALGAFSGVRGGCALPSTALLSRMLLWRWAAGTEHGRRALLPALLCPQDAVRRS